MYYICTYKQINIETMVNKTNSLFGKMKNLAYGESLVISLNEPGAKSVRTSASMLGLQYNRRYSVSLDRTARTYTITRHE